MDIEHWYSIRLATTDDVAGLLECLRQAFEPYRGLYTRDAYDDTILTPETIGQRLASMQVYVAVTDTNEVIGTVACKMIDEKQGHLRGMAVLPEWHSSGLASVLLKTAETALATSGCYFITLNTTAPLERAIHFYKRNGFHATGRITDFFGMQLYQYAKTISI